MTGYRVIGRYEIGVYEGTEREAINSHLLMYPYDTVWSTTPAEIGF